LKLINVQIKLTFKNKKDNLINLTTIFISFDNTYQLLKALYLIINRMQTIQKNA